MDNYDRPANLDIYVYCIQHYWHVSLNGIEFTKWITKHEIYKKDMEIRRISDVKLYRSLCHGDLDGIQYTILLNIQNDYLLVVPHGPSSWVCGKPAWDGTNPLYLYRFDGSGEPVPHEI